MTVRWQETPLRHRQSFPDFGEKSFLVAFLYRLVLMAAGLALFLPFFGPMVDHHLAERHPNHAHIFLSPDAAGHTHFYDEGSSSAHHHRDAGFSLAGNPGDDSDRTGVAFLTSNDGVGQSVTSLAATTLHLEVTYPAPGSSPPFLRLGEDDVRPPESFVSPPRRPPRV